MAGKGAQDLGWRPEQAEEAQAHAWALKPGWMGGRNICCQVKGPGVSSGLFLTYCAAWVVGWPLWASVSTPGNEHESSVVSEALTPLVHVELPPPWQRSDLWCLFAGT